MFFVKIKKLLHTVKKKDFFSENDMFIKITYGTDIRITTTKWNTRDPIWNEMFLFDYKKNINNLTLELFEQGMYRASKLHEFTFKVEHKGIHQCKKHIFLIEMGDIYFVKNKQIDSLNTSVKDKNERINSLLHTINNLHTQIDGIEQNKKEQIDIIEIKKKKIEELNKKINKIIDFLNLMKKEINN